jgi:superfamily II DNA or RNA helicase
MITPALLDRFLEGVRGQALREGTRYAGEARVGDLVGSGEGVSTVVRGQTGDFETALWAEDGALEHRCSCPSWRDPCKHQVAAALVLRQCLSKAPGFLGGLRPERDGTPGHMVPDPEQARRQAVEERRLAARREKLRVRLDTAPLVRVVSPSGFAYRVHLRGDADGPHSCDCPDFEANRLHACKHVESVRAYLRRTKDALPARHRRAAGRARIYLHFGELVEPRLLGRPEGPGAPAVRAAFDERGVPLQALARDEDELRRRLGEFGPWVEAHALEWLAHRARRRPEIPAGKIERLLPRLPLDPYGFQWEGAAFLARTGRALLADEMGLGKTVQAILAAAVLRRAEHPAEHVTIVCPASLRGGWQDEIRKWLDEDATLLEGGSPTRAATIASRPRWLVTHYEQVLRDFRHHETHPPDLLVVDEAQRAKGLRTRTARVLKAIPARYLFALTGTPLENRLEEAYAVAQLIDQRLLPPLWQIDRDHFVRDEKGRRVVMYRNLDAMRSRLAPAFLRRRKEDVALQLPDRVRSVVMVPMHSAVKDNYEDVMAAVARIASKKVILPPDLDRMQRLLVIARRCCNGPHMLGLAAEDRKVPKLAELEEALRDLCLGEGRKAVVFSEWTDMTEQVVALCDRLRLPVFHLRGDVPVKQRPALIRSFTEQKSPAVFVSTDAGGIGLNLQAADVVVNLDLPWNPARLEQRIARAHRIGSKRTVQVLLLVCKDSVEERILRLHDTKRNVLENIWSREGEDAIAAPGGSGAFREMLKALLATRAPVREAEALAAAEPSEARAETPAGGGSVPSASAPTVDAASLAAAVAAVAPALPPEHRKSLAVVFRALAEALEA